MHLQVRWHSILWVLIDNDSWYRAYWVLSIHCIVLRKVRESPCKCSCYDITLLNHRLARIYTESKQFGEVLTLLKNNGDFFATIPKAKTAKTVRNILNIVASVPDSLDIQINLCKDVIDWCKIEKRTFLRQRIEAKVKFDSVELHM